MTKQLISFFITLSLLSGNVYSQISAGGIPKGLNKSYSALLKNNIPVFATPGIDIEKLKAEDLINDNQKEIPWRFGKNIDVAIDIIQSGQKDILPDNSKIWRLRIFSQGAITLNFCFNNYNLPEGAKLFFYNTETQEILGAFTSYNNREDKIFATTLIKGESIVIEYEEPANSKFAGKLILDRITHGYRNAFEYSKGFGSSGSCNINVGCPEANFAQDQIRSVCMLVVNNNAFCSGALINNTQNDGTPYLLTANHCSTGSNFSNWVFWFNWQSTSCTNPTSSPAHQSVSGCTLKARKSDSDFCLVQLSDIPPASYNVFYSGWDRTENTSPNGFCIHHPSGDIKKISLANSLLYAEDYSGFITWRADWTTGATEPGSSGSPLYNSGFKIIGQLYGGPSSCNASQADKHDYYGRLSISWDDTSSSTRLKDWLDPLNTGLSSIEGYDPVLTTDDAQVFQIITPENFYCTDQPISPVVIIKNKGTNNLTSVIVNYKTETSDIVSANWNGILLPDETDTVSLPDFTSSGGSHLFKAFTSNPNGINDLNHYNDTAYFNFVVKGIQLPFAESFESSTFPPSGWSIENHDSSFTWIRKPAYGISGNFAAYINFFYYNSPGQKDELITPVIDLPVSNAQLTFYHAYRRKNSNNQDSLKIYISRNCGLTFDLVPIFNKSGISLATGPETTNIFTPSVDTSWVKDTVYLASYSGNSIKLKFVSVTDYGNNLYIDNIQINYPVNSNELNFENHIQVYPNPTRNNIYLTNISQQSSLQVFDLSGKLIISFDKIIGDKHIILENLPEGMYVLKVFSEKNIFYKKIILVK